MKKLILLFAVAFNLHAQEWAQIDAQFDPPGNYILYYAAMGDENNLWFVDDDTGKIFHTSDGGFNWLMQRDSIISAGSYRWDIFFVDSLFGWVLASKEDSTFILKTSDGGKSWVKINSPHFLKIHFLNREKGYAAGHAGIYYTHDGGINWEKSIYDEEEIPNGIIAVSQIVFVNERRGWIILQPGNNWEGWSIIMESDDYGISWREKRTNISGLISPVDVFFVDTLNAYATSNLTIFLSTTDGGATWELKSSKGFYSIFFTNITNGWGTGGLGAGIYQTNDGGLEWDKKLSNINVYARFHFKKNVPKVYVFGFDESIYVYDITVDVEKHKNDSLPTDFVLYQNYPNPFNPATKIRFEVINSDNYTLKLFDVVGNEITTLLNSYLTPETYDMIIEKSSLSSGIYFATLSNSKNSQTIKLVLVQ